MKRYKVAIKNSKENRIELTFSDLCVKYSNGFSPVLKIKEGEEIPLDVCDPEDIRKSWLVGSLKGYLENKWIEEISEEIKPLLPIAPTSQFIAESDIKIIVPPQEVPPQTILPEVAQKVISVVNESITDLNLVYSYEDFCKLTHFLKLRFIKENNNIDLLKDILGKTPSSQFKNNINLRLSQSFK